jgi:putative OPT family oligopeptide transporter
MASVASGIFGSGLPWNMVAIGAAVGAIVIALDEWLKARGASWRAPVLAVAVGIYLPLELSTPIFTGGLIAELATRWHRRRHPGKDPEILKQTGLLFAAGLIAGEAIVGVLIAIPIVASGDADVLAVAENMRPGQWAGLAGLALVGWWMHTVATRQAKLAKH